MKPADQVFGGSRESVHLGQLCAFWAASERVPNYAEHPEPARLHANFKSNSDFLRERLHINVCAPSLAGSRDRKRLAPSMCVLRLSDSRTCSSCDWLFFSEMQLFNIRHQRQFPGALHLMESAPSSRLRGHAVETTTKCLSPSRP